MCTVARLIPSPELEIVKLNGGARRSPCTRGAGRPADAREHAARGHALEHTRHGPAVRVEPDGGEPDLARVRVAAPPRRDIQALERSAVYRESAGHRGSVSAPPRQSPGPVCR